MACPTAGRTATCYSSVCMHSHLVWALPIFLLPCSVDLPDGRARGYVLEVFAGHFQLPELGPIGGYSTPACCDIVDTEGC